MCEMCGTEAKLLHVDIEGVKLNVCQKCGKFGKVIAEVRSKAPAMKISKPESQGQLVQVLIEDYAARIGQARQNLGFKQKELAKLMRERESLIQKVESGQFEPSVRLARKFENHLRIKLVEQHQEKHEKNIKTEKATLTIGDMIQLK